MYRRRGRWKMLLDVGGISRSLDFGYCGRMYMTQGRKCIALKHYSRSAHYEKHHYPFIIHQSMIQNLRTSSLSSNLAHNSVSLRITSSSFQSCRRIFLPSSSALSQSHELNLSVHHHVTCLSCHGLLLTDIPVSPREVGCWCPRRGYHDDRPAVQSSSWTVLFPQLHCNHTSVSCSTAHVLPCCTAIA